jgi:uncharacterized protein (UPF0333 family)
MEYLLLVVAIILTTSITQFFLKKKFNEEKKELSISLSSQLAEVKQQLNAEQLQRQDQTSSLASKTDSNLKIISDTLEESANSADATSLELE